MLRYITTAIFVGATLVTTAPPISAADAGAGLRRTPGEELVLRSQRRAANEVGNAATRAARRAAGPSSVGRLLTGFVRDAASIGRRSIDRR